MKRIIFLYIFIATIVSISCSSKKEQIQQNQYKYSQNELNEKFIECIDTFDFDKATYWLSLGADANIMYKDQSILSYSTLKNWTDFSITLIEYGADINWIDPKDKVSVFSNVISRNNLILGKYFIDHNVDLSYKDFSNHTYFEESIFNKQDEDNPFYHDYRFTYLLLSDNRMKEIIRNDTKILYSIIGNWSSEMPKILGLIYGDDYIFPDDPPVLLVSISENQIEALKYFVSKNCLVNKEYYYQDLGESFKPTELADLYYEEAFRNLGYESDSTKKFENICLYLEDLEKIEKVVH